MIFSIIAILIMLYSIIDLKRGFLVFLIYQLIWFPDTRLISIRGFASINLNLVMSLFFSALYIIKKQSSGKNKSFYAKKMCLIKKYCFPYKHPMFVMAFSLLLTCFTSVNGFSSEFVRAVGAMFLNLIMVYLIWQIIETKKDFQFLFQGITIVAFVTCIYGLWEYINQNNPLLVYKFSLAGNTLSTYTIGTRGYRMYSIFEHPISAAMMLSLYTVFVITAIVVYKEKIAFKWIAYITCVLCLPCMIMTKMRTAFVFLALGMFAFIDINNKRFLKIALASIIVIFMISPVISNNLVLFTSLFNKSTQLQMGGSNLHDRLRQLNAVYQLMKMSPIAGLGQKFRTVISNIYTTQALDFESLWFEQMSKHGIVGVLAYIYMIYYSIYKIPKKYKSKQILFVSLAYWGTYTLTSTPYFRVYLYYLAIFYFIKKSEVYKQMMRQKMGFSLGEKSLAKQLRGVSFNGNLEC